MGARAQGLPVRCRGDAGEIQGRYRVLWALERKQMGKVSLTLTLTLTRYAMKQMGEDKVDDGANFLKTVPNPNPNPNPNPHPNPHPHPHPNPNPHSTPSPSPSPSP